MQASLGTRPSKSRGKLHASCDHADYARALAFVHWSGACGRQFTVRRDTHAQNSATCTVSVFISPSLDMRLVSVDSIHLALGGFAFGEYHTHPSILLLNSDVLTAMRHLSAA